MLAAMRIFKTVFTIGFPLDILLSQLENEYYTERTRVRGVTQNSLRAELYVQIFEASQGIVIGYESPPQTTGA